MNKKQLYEHIMSDAAKIVKRHIETSWRLDEDYIENIETEEREPDFVMEDAIKSLIQIGKEIEKPEDSEGSSDILARETLELVYNNRLKDKIGIIKPDSDDDFRTLVKGSVKVFGNECSLNWIDTGSVTDMSKLFYFSVFNGDISKWNTSSVTNMHRMFQQSNFNGDISKWNTSNVKMMSGTFMSSHFNQDISDWDVSNVRTFIYMFRNSSFTGDLRRWNINPTAKTEHIFQMSDFNPDFVPEMTERQKENCGIRFNKKEMHI